MLRNGLPVHVAHPSALRGSPSVVVRSLAVSTSKSPGPYSRSGSRSNATEGAPSSADPASQPSVHKSVQCVNKATMRR